MYKCILYVCILSMYNKYRHSHDRRKKKGSGSNLLSTCHCFKSGKAIQFISIHVRVNSIYFYIRAHCSDEVASDENQAKRNSAWMLLNSQLKDKMGVLCSVSGVSWSKNSLTIKLDCSNTSDSIMVPNASQMGMTRAESAWDIPYLNRKIFLFCYQIFKSDFFCH